METTQERRLDMECHASFLAPLLGSPHSRRARGVRAEQLSAVSHTALCPPGEAGDDSCRARHRSAYRVGATAPPER